ncbi:MAG TPA: NAD(P)H-dependent glycerol-3-phosphate dehydrogenase [Gammaproteobacteria bacterium]|nr:NAD(P)H-dependent glycerol-3-phosphate dehydrogenase [Gammaproteobacteria bacterium]
MPNSVINAPTKIAVIGTGSWGTALAVLLAKNGLHVNFWGRNQSHLQELQNDRCNNKYLPGIAFPDKLHIQYQLSSCLQDVETILLVVPSSGVRHTLEQILTCPTTNHEIRIAIASKGFEDNTLCLLHDVVNDVLGKNTDVCIVSGPTFAMEVAKGLPTAITVASKNQTFASQIANYLSNDHFRAYTNDDIIGVEVGGAVKNIMAIAAGIADGLGFGANTRAALITRALVEISRLGQRLGGKPETFMGMAGLGDLILTCTDNQSRNRRVGLGLAKNKSLLDIQNDLGQVAEGISTTKKVYLLSKKLNIEMPIVEQVYNVLYENEAPIEAVKQLLARDTGSEFS